MQLFPKHIASHCRRSSGLECSKVCHTMSTFARSKRIKKVRREIKKDQERSRKVKRFTGALLPAKSAKAPQSEKSNGVLLRRQTIAKHLILCKRTGMDWANAAWWCAYTILYYIVHFGLEVVAGLYTLLHGSLSHTHTPHFDMHFLRTPIFHHLLSLSCLSHPVFTFFLPLIGRIWHVGLSGPLVDSSFASREILVPEWKQWTQWKPCNQWCCSCERDWRNRQRAVQWSHAYFTQFYTHIYNVIIYALYTYMIDTNPHRTDEIGSGCLRGDMMWTIELWNRSKITMNSIGTY